MTVAMEKPPALDELLDTLDLPPGYKAETIEEQIVVTPPPDFGYQSAFMRLTFQFSQHGWFVSGNSGLRTPLGKFIPDLFVVPQDYQPAGSDEVWCSPEGVALVVEITSSNPSIDRDEKRRGYASAGIPLYLLVDRKAKESIVFSEPAKGDYRTVSSRPITEPIPLPEPFSFTLEDVV
jgi:Uma2 family endonuclease